MRRAGVRLLFRVAALAREVGRNGRGGLVLLVDELSQVGGRGGLRLEERVQARIGWSRRGATHCSQWDDAPAGGLNAARQRDPLGEQRQVSTDWDFCRSGALVVIGSRALTSTHAQQRHQAHTQRHEPFY